MKKPARGPYRIQDLVLAANVSKRTVTRWIAHGILAGPAPRSGPGAEYTAEQLQRTLAAATLRGHGEALEVIRDRLDRAAPAELEAWARGELTAPAPAPSVTPATPASPAVPEHAAIRYDHVDLAPGLTLLLRAGCDPAVQALAQEIYARYGPGRRVP